jgi:two-component SAPR family response regulator
MVMRMETEEASVALLGVADAAYLGGGGRLLLRLDGREPVELYGYQIAAEHLERLAQLMRHGYSAPSHTSDTDAAELPPPPPDKAADGGALDASEASEAVVSETDEPPLQETTSLVPTKMTDATGVASAEPSAPIQVRCFGLPRVECHGHLVWPHGGGDAKPWELLLYLATQPADGVTHASAMEALWPAAKAQAMADDANHRFRQLRYRLRRQLQQVANAPANEGIAMDRRGLRLDPAIVHSDAQEFLTLEREVRVHQDPQGHHAIAQLERMRSLYVGDLLDGPDVRRYAWVDERDDSGVTLREHFRRLFQDACARLAAAYTSAGRIHEAIDVYHDLTDMDPSDERLFQALFRLHAAAGDLAGLKAEERRMQTLLRDLALDLDPLDTQVQEPDRETMEEFHRLCASLRDRERNREREHEAATASV